MVRERLSPYFVDVSTQLTPLAWDLPMSATEAADFFARNAGGFQIVLNNLDEQSRSALLADNEHLWIQQNTAINAASRTHIQNNYLEVHAAKPNRG